MPKTTLVLKPAIFPMTSLAVIGLPFLALGIWVAVDMVRTGDWSVITVISSLGVILLGLWLSLEVATVRIYLTPDALLLRRFWRTRWVVLRNRASLVPDFVGQGGFLPGLRVYETGKAGHVGEILNTQFRSADLERLQRVLEENTP
jgi:hypothetical protein